jgi:YD repeat-containing protein
MSKEGNQIRKEEQGKTWHFTYAANGMLCSVTLPDESQVLFSYDPLGRRIKKETRDKTTNKATNKTTNKLSQHILWEKDMSLRKDT